MIELTRGLTRISAGASITRRGFADFNIKEPQAIALLVIQARIRCRAAARAALIIVSTECCTMVEQHSV